MNLNNIFCTILLIVFSSLLFATCKSEKVNIQGHWTSKPMENCPNKMFPNGITSVSYEFMSNGTCKTIYIGNSGEGEATVDFPETNYELKGDSLIMTFSDDSDSRLAFKCEQKDENHLLLIRNYLDNGNSICNSTTELSRIQN